MEFAALRWYDQFDKMFRHPGLESFAVRLQEANDINSYDSPGFAVNRIARRFKAEFTANHLFVLNDAKHRRTISKKPGHFQTGLSATL